MNIFKSKKSIETNYDFSAVSMAVKDGEFSYEEVQTLKVIAQRYLCKCNETDASLLANILKDFVDPCSDYGTACICKEILRVGA